MMTAILKPGNNCKLACNKLFAKGIEIFARGFVRGVTFRNTSHIITLLQKKVTVL